MILKSDRIGEIGHDSDGNIMVITEYRSSKDIDVLFPNTGYVAKNVRYDNFKRGLVKDYYKPSVRGIGYLGDTNSRINGEKKQSYSSWEHMLSRCYDPNDCHYKYYGGRGVFVRGDWHCFAEFEQWYDTNFYDIGEPLQLDKDLFSNNSMCYCSSFCCLVPQSINLILRDMDNSFYSVDKNGDYKIDINFTSDEKYNYTDTVTSEEVAVEIVNCFKAFKLRDITALYEEKGLPTHIVKALYNLALSYYSEDKMSDLIDIDKLPIKELTISIEEQLKQSKSKDKK